MPDSDSVSPQPSRLPVPDVAIVDAPAGWANDGACYPPDDSLDQDSLQDTVLEDDTDPESAEQDQANRAIIDNVGSHLDELRRRLIVSLSVFTPLFAIGLWLYQPLWGLIIRPLSRAAPHLTRFQALGPSDGLVMAMRIAFAFALFLSLPVWLAQVWLFVSPGLRSGEKRLVYLSLGSGGLLFVIGAAMAYLVGIPFALEFLLPFNQSLEGWENAFTGTGYVDFIITCCAGFGLAFELPLVMLILGRVGILTPEVLTAWWRPAVLVIFILAAVMTPPDPFTLLLLAIPMLGLFLAGWWLVRWTCKERSQP